jgi:3-hydroxyisobutyrate dehydrogenase
MGSAFSERLLSKGNKLLVFDVDSDRLDMANRAGAAIADSIAALARKCKIVSLLVRTDEELLNATVSPGGVLETGQPGSILLIHSTVLPTTTLTIAEAATARGARVVDACPTGTPREARAGDATFLVGGDHDLLDLVGDYLLRIGKSWIHVGPLGSGNVAKLVANILIASERLVLEEALLLGEAAGIEFRALLNVLRATQGDHRSVVTEWERAFDPMSPTPVLNPGANLISKDLPLASDFATSLSLHLPIVRAMELSAKRFIDEKPSRDEQVTGSSSGSWSN